MPFDHAGYYVWPSQLEAEVSFLTASLAHMGIKELMRPVPTVVGLGPDKDPFLWVAAFDNLDGNGKGETEDVGVKLPHFALKAASKSLTFCILDYLHLVRLGF
jgi:hypothetical protein